MAHAHETRFHLSPKRTSPFKSVGVSVQSTAGSRGVRISLSNAGYTTFEGGVRVLATHSIRQFPFHFPPVRHRVPPGSERTIKDGVQVIVQRFITNFLKNGLASFLEAFVATQFHIPQD